MVEGENLVVEIEAQAGLGRIEIGRRGERFQMPGEFVADEADGPALEGRQIGMRFLAMRGKDRVECRQRRPSSIAPSASTVKAAKGAAAT